MFRKFFITAVFACAATATTIAQSTVTESAPARARRTQTATTKPAVTSDAATAGVRAAFERLLDGIRESDITKVMNVYQDSPRLAVFNNNGTVTRGANNYRSTREQIYAKAKNVRLDVRDVDVRMLGRDGAIVSCLWTQEQTVGGTTEAATGRMTIAFERVGNEWKAVHTHTSPDAPDPSRLLPSERTTTTAPATTTSPATPVEVVPGAQPAAPKPTLPPATRPATRP